MKRIGIIGLCFATVLVFSALSASGASANPPKWWHCLKEAAGVGNYSSRANCEKLITGGTGWAWLEVGPIGALALRIIGRRVIGSPVPLLETEAKRTVECTGASNNGEIGDASATAAGLVAKVLITFTGCKSTSFGAECNTKGKAKGEIVSNDLKGRLGIIKAAAPAEAGVLLEAEASGGLEAEFECTAFETLKVRGNIICPVTPYKTAPNMAKTFFLNCAQTGGKQAVKKFEGEATEHTLETEGKGLENFAFEKSAERAEAEIEAEAVEGSTPEIGIE